MWFYVQMALPLLTVGLAAAICFTVTPFIMGHAQPHPVSPLARISEAKTR
jgi:hypothetical protein